MAGKRLPRKSSFWSSEVVFLFFFLFLLFFFFLLSFFFQEYTAIDLSWHQRHLQMTPLFAATQASQSVAMAMGTVDQSLGGSRGPGVHLRATQQAVAFTPTQGQPRVC